MAKYISILSALFLSLFMSAQAHANSQASYQACDMTVQEDVYWDAIGETVTLHFTMTGDGQYFPTGTVHMEFSDKQKILLTEGGKYVDDAEDIGCAVQIESVKSSLIGNLSGTYKSYYAQESVSTMGEVAALLADEAFCAKEINPYTTEWLAETNGRESNLSKIENSNVWYSQYMQCNPIVENISFRSGKPDGMNLETFNRLVADNAPLIDIPYAYGADTHVFDRETRKLILFSTSGC